MGSLALQLTVLPIYYLLAVAEAFWLIRRGRAYDRGEALASVGVTLGHFLTSAAMGGLGLALTTVVYRHRILDLGTGSVLSWLGLFIGVEFFYYWYHRAAHEIRFFWATHTVHHSANQLTLLSAYRLGWTSVFSGSVLFFLPLAWLGFPPQAIFLVFALNLLYQFWLHTELVPKLGPLEWVLNTPSHHRVHHAANGQYLDANYGGVLIVFDRLFGTLRVERDDLPCRFGLVKPVTTRNPFRLVFGEWIAVGRDVAQARSWRERWHYVFGLPGWSPDGSRQTSAMLRAAAERAETEREAAAVGAELLILPRQAAR